MNLREDYNITICDFVLSFILSDFVLNEAFNAVDAPIKLSLEPIVTLFLLYLETFDLDAILWQLK